MFEKIMFIIFASIYSNNCYTEEKGEGGRREGKRRRWREGRRRVGGTVWFSPRTLKVGKWFKSPT